MNKNQGTGATLRYFDLPRQNGIRQAEKRRYEPLQKGGAPGVNNFVEKAGNLCYDETCNTQLK